jgi:SAM-dependent methyltransferase
MTPAERWHAAISPFVHTHLPTPPARVLEIGCGTLGGFVPMLRAGGYEATGIDPDAPDGSGYQRTTFERAELPERVDAVMASTSLHHVNDPAEVLDRVASVLVGGGTLIVVEWAWEDFDEATARWCFDRLATSHEHGWLHRHRENWLASERSWELYLSDWACREGLHAGRRLLDALDQRFDRVFLNRGPYLFVDLPDTSEAAEQLAIDRGEIRATRIDYVGLLPAA